MSILPVLVTIDAARSSMGLNPIWGLAPRPYKRSDYSTLTECKDQSNRYEEIRYGGSSLSAPVYKLPVFCFFVGIAIVAALMYYFYGKT